VDKMFMKKPKHRNFEFTPRFYDPLKDEEEKRKRKIRIGFERNRIKPRNTIYKNLILLIIVVIVILILSRGI